jgi:hypothetical protein
MKYILAFLSRFRPMQLLIPVLLSAVLLFASGCAAETTNSNPDNGTVQMDNIKRGFPAGNKSATSKGTVQLNEIEQKAEEAIDSPATSRQTIEERSKGALNEIQGDAADRGKMNRSNDPKLPVVKQTEKALSKMKNG